jgi:hypothetical protein
MGFLVSFSFFFWLYAFMLLLNIMLLQQLDVIDIFIILIYFLYLKKQRRVWFVAFPVPVFEINLESRAWRAGCETIAPPVHFPDDTYA